MNLRQAGYEVETSETGRDALDLLRRSPPDLVVLDLMLPDVTGTEICRRMRSDIDLSEIPIIMLTAKADEVDRVVGLELGADDYVTKPFSPRELTLRVRAVLRRRKPAAAPSEALAHGTLRLDAARHRCFVGGGEIDLTAKEFGMLAFFASRPGRALTRDDILDAVWGRSIIVTPRSIDRCVVRLRAKVEPDPRNPIYIQTIRDIGYRFEPGAP